MPFWEITGWEELGFPPQHLPSTSFHTFSLDMLWVARETLHTHTHTTAPHTTPHMHASIVFSFPSARPTSFSSQNRQRNWHLISNDKLTKDIAWYANLIKCLHFGISCSPGKKSGGDIVVPASVRWSLETDKLNNSNWEKKITLRAESSSLNLIDPINWTNVKFPFYFMLWMPF